MSYQVGSVTGQFMRAFHECYKDGTGDRDRQTDNKNDFRWFAGVYFVFRFIVYAAIAFPPDAFTMRMILQIVFVGGLLSFAVFRPYKNDWYNKLDASMFALLTAINTLSMYSYFLILMNGRSPVVSIFVVYILTLCPLGYIIFFVVRYLYKKYFGTFSRCMKKMWPFSVYFAGRDDEEDNRDFIEYTEGTGRLRGEMEYSVNIAEARNRQRSILEELNRSAKAEDQVLLLEDPKEEEEGHNSGSSNQSSGYGATGSAVTGLSENSVKEEAGDNLTSFGVDRMGVDAPPPVKDRRKRLYLTK